MPPTAGHPANRSSFGPHVAVLSVAVAITVTASLVSPKTIPFALSLLAIAVFLALYAEGRLKAAVPAFGQAEWTVVAFIGLCALSMLWANEHTAGIIPVVAAAACLAGCAFIMHAFYGESPENIGHIARGLVWGLIAGIVYLFIEILSHQAIKLWVYNTLHIPKSWLRPPVFFKWNGDKLVSILSVDLTRNMAPLTLTVWGALLIAYRRWSGRAAVALFAAAVIVIMISEHETSKVAIVWSGLVFLLATRSLRWSGTLLRVSWVAACLAVIPATLALHRLDLQNSVWLQSSLRHRIIIWNHTAEETMKQPLFGIGAGMMYRMDPRGVVPEEGDEWTGASPHAHNAYLQTWFELGAIGAAILTLFGLAVLARIENFEEKARPFAHAAFAAAMAMAAASYGVWQSWFLALFEMSFIMFTVALRYAQTVDLPASGGQ